MLLILIGGLGGRLLFSPSSPSSSSQPADAADSTDSHGASAEEAEAGGPSAPSNTIAAEEEPPREVSSRETTASSVTDAEPREAARDREEPAGRENLAVAPTTVESNPVEDLPPEDDRLIDQPTFTPFTTPPKLTNTAQVRRLLERHYPPNYRAAGLGSSVEVWLYIDERGIVQNAQVKTSSKYPGSTVNFDDAALAVAREMVFTPAQNRGVTVPVWEAQMITFSVQ